MPDPLHVRLSQTMRDGKGVSQADWAWIIARLSPEQKRVIEAMASEHECSTLAVLRDWPDLFDFEGDDDGD